MNTNQITKKHILDLLFEDGNGPDEVLADSAKYAEALGLKATPTAKLRIERIARGIIREAKKQSDTDES